MARSLRRSDLIGQHARKSGRSDPGPKVQVVRLMAPFSMQCTTCGEYIYKGRKFNARKETPVGEKYLEIQIFRFYIRCTRCSAEITFKTDPKNMDYACEHGARRNYEPWREKCADRLAEEEADQDERGAMEKLEDKMHDARREMDVADALDEIRTRNARRERAGRSGVDISGPVARANQDTVRKEEEETDSAAWLHAQAKAKDAGLIAAVMPAPLPPVLMVAKAAPAKKQGLVKGIKKKEHNDGASKSLVGYESDSDG
ncbi:hypothetical protein KVT40_005668 [Elsinoe batatas]|uniref:Splicing factor YJU2 n=1 Tax=Elsinoe batatas TaxID=2601811 RepID=A0A8K0L6P5_9PEZI|nr:hypothetical protein KVT40_005668 [Elsinoe batatas]